MLICFDWLKDYVRIDESAESIADKLTMTGLNLESVETAANGQTVIDLEVTSNRPDCLGHLGVAREVAAITGGGVCMPAAKPAESTKPATEAIRVVNEANDVCPQYTARVIRGVKIGPSPEWLVARLATIGINSVNNVVDVTNYVMFECAQPFHAFDYDKLRGSQIIVRPAKAGETIRAIDQRDYKLTPSMLVIADAERPVAIAGVMGGLDTEISNGTTNVLIETASFQPLTVRATARALELHSPSSHRFERALDLHGLDWAGRRCCELIQQVAGGEVLQGVVVAGAPPAPQSPISLRATEIQRVLGIQIPIEVVGPILQKLGCKVEAAGSGLWNVIPPTFRRDLTREIDLVEEVARIHGYSHIPDDTLVPLCSSRKTAADEVGDRLRAHFVACGFYEAMTLSFTNAAQQTWFQPRGVIEPLAVDHSRRRQDDLLRQSLVPSLLTARRDNERRGNVNVSLFELARIYLSADRKKPVDECEPLSVGGVTGKSFLECKGVIESLVSSLAPLSRLEAVSHPLPEAAAGRSCKLLLDSQRWGWLAELSPATIKAAEVTGPVVAFEFDFAPLLAVFQPSPQYRAIPPFQSVVRDLNFVVPEALEWTSLDRTVRAVAGGLLEDVRFGGEYRGKQIPAGSKSYLLTLVYRAPDRTLTHADVETIQQAVIAACTQNLQAQLRA